MFDLGSLLGTSCFWINYSYVFSDSVPRAYMVCPPCPPGAPSLSRSTLQFHNFSRENISSCHRLSPRNKPPSRGDVVEREKNLDWTARG